MEDFISVEGASAPTEMPSMPAKDVAITKEGWLQKMGHGSFVTWAKRWTVLEGDTVNYYSDEKKTSHKGYFKLNVLSTVRQSMPLEKIMFGDSRNATGIVIQNVIWKRPKERTFYFVAEDQQSVNAWVAAMNHNIAYTYYNEDARKGSLETLMAHEGDESYKNAQKMLLEHEWATFKSKDELETAIMNNRLTELAMKGDGVLMESFEKQHADVDITWVHSDLFDGQVPTFFIACSAGNGKLCDYLIEKKKTADIDFQDPKLKATSLQVAARHGRVEIVDKLLTLGAKLDIQNVKGNTALHLAVREGHLKVVRALLAAGADTTLENEQEMKAQEMSSLPKIQEAFEAAGSGSQVGFRVAPTPQASAEVSGVDYDSEEEQEEEEQEEVASKDKGVVVKAKNEGTPITDEAFAKLQAQLKEQFLSSDKEKLLDQSFSGGLTLSSKQAGILADGASIYAKDWLIKLYPSVFDTEHFYGDAVEVAVQSEYEREDVKTKLKL